MPSTDAGKVGSALGLRSLRSEWQYLAAAAALGSAVGLALGIAVSSKWSSRQTRKDAQQPAKADINGKESGAIRSDPREARLLKNPAAEIKMVLCVRMDLKMGKGKIAAQCSHASMGMYKKLAKLFPNLLTIWENSGQPKIVVKCKDDNQIDELIAAARNHSIPVYTVIDQGRTQIAPNSRTILAVIGPSDALQEVTGHLTLL